MTIKDFAKLCGCNPQTLRYYDRLNLLKPVRVDEWTGYRHYDEEQAIAFVKIKNLQKAGFSIEEIENLLDKDDTEIYFAFEKKIEEQEKQLQEIKNIQKNDPDYTTVFEKHYWEYVKDFFDDLPEIEDGKEYKFLVRLGEEKKANASFANTLVTVMCMRNPDKRMKVSCNVIASDDGENHFWCRTK